VFVSLYRLAMASLLLLVGSCLSQDKAGVDQTVAVPEVQKILSNAQLSGSLEYWGLCDTAKPRLPELKLRPVSGHQGSALDILQEMFADDPKMWVTQEGDGKIRMVETDVPNDFLEVKIHHLSFPPNYHSGAMALYAILNTPEVIEFMNRNIGQKTAWEGWGLPGQIVVGRFCASVWPAELNDVTVARALDYVLGTYPGFWSYQNCYTAEGARKISVSFLKLTPVSDRLTSP
jgi:hypothetical protein